LAVGGAVLTVVSGAVQNTADALTNKPAVHVRTGTPCVAAFSFEAKERQAAKSSRLDLAPDQENASSFCGTWHLMPVPVMQAQPMQPVVQAL
jgi:hypothetical protein